MERLRKIWEHPNFERIRNSVEFKHLKKEALLVCGLLGGLFALMLILISSLAEGTVYLKPKAAIQMMLMGLFVLGSVSYYLYRIWELFWYIDRYTFSTALLDKPHQGYRGSIYFTVEVLNRQGKTVTKDTRNLFSQGEPNFEEYLNRQVLVGYNDEADIVVVIQKLP